MESLRIAYISESSPADRHAWSGTVHYVHRALTAAGHHLSDLGPAHPGALRYLLGALNKLSLLVFRKRIDYRHSKLYSRAFGRIFSKRLRSVPHDVVIVCGSTECGAYLVTNSPVFYVLDRTIAGALNYHTILSDLWPFSAQQSVATDKKAMLEAAGIFFSSEWAAGHARQLYRIPEKKIKVQPFGANLDAVPDRAAVLTPKAADRCNLLLIGTYWHNKGADIAFNTLLKLLERNMNAFLTVVGCEPPEPLHHERLRIISFVDKNSDEGLNQLRELFLAHHFFILPTRFDCTPIVFCEAAAFGVPVLSADTGGVAGHVKEGVNGFLIPYEDQGEGYAAKILEVFSDQETYRRLCSDSRSHYEQSLNWERWAEVFAKTVQGLR